MYAYTIITYNNIYTILYYTHTHTILYSYSNMAEVDNLLTTGLKNRHNIGMYVYYY